MKHSSRFMSGLGSVAIIFGSLRALENQPAIYFIFVLGGLSYGLGMLLEK